MGLMGRIHEDFFGNRRATWESKAVADETANIRAEALAFEPAGGPVWSTAVPADKDLLQQCRQGDMRAFEVLVKRYQDRVFNATYRFCGNYQDACELTQETFLRAMRGIAGFRGDAKFYTWLFRIALNLTRSHRRRAGRRRFRSLDDCPGTLEASSQAAGLLGAGQADPAQQALKAEQHSRVMAALGRLAQQYRAVIVLKDVDGLDYQEIAEILDIPVGTVKSRAHRGRQALREYLADLVN